MALKFKLDIDTSALTTEEVDYIRQQLIAYSYLDEADIQSMEQADLVNYFFNEIAYIKAQTDNTFKLLSFNGVRRKFDIESFELESELEISIDQEILENQNTVIIR